MCIRFLIPQEWSSPEIKGYFLVSREFPRNRQLRDIRVLKPNRIRMSLIMIMIMVSMLLLIRVIPWCMNMRLIVASRLLIMMTMMLNRMMKFIILLQWRLYSSYHKENDKDVLERPYMKLILQYEIDNQWWMIVDDHGM